MFTLLHVNAVESDISAIWFQQVEYQAEEGGLAGTIVADKSYNLSAADRQLWYVTGAFLAE